MADTEPVCSKGSPEFGIGVALTPKLFAHTLNLGWWRPTPHSDLRAGDINQTTTTTLAAKHAAELPATGARAHVNNGLLGEKETRTQRAKAKWD